MKNSFEGEWRQIIFPMISAILFAFCFPPYNVFPVAFIAFVPLLIATLTAKKSLHARGGGFIFGFLFYSWSLRWLWNIFPGFSILLWIAIALFPALFAWGLFLLKQRFNRAIALSFAPFIWLGLEYFRSECWFLKFAWLTPGFSQATNLPFLQFASVLGVYGISVLVLAVNCCICYLIIGKFALKKRWIPTGLILLFISLIYFWGGSQVQQPSMGNFPVGAIQTEASSLRENRELSLQLAGKARLIVWPEYSLMQYVNPDTELFTKLADLARESQAYLIVGAKEKIPGSDDNKFYNTALLLSPTGEKIGSYYKNNPVQFFDDGTPGNSFPVFDTELGKIGIAICYDMDFPYVFRNLVQNGAEILAVPTYDAMWWSELQHLQHSAMAPARAIEYRRWVVRAASSGISQVIDPFGRVKESLGVGLTGTISGEIEGRSSLTFYASFGYLLPPFCLVLVVGYFVFELIVEIRKRGIRKDASQF